MSNESQCKKLLLFGQDTMCKYMYNFQLLEGLYVLHYSCRWQHNHPALNTENLHYCRILMLSCSKIDLEKANWL